jgi:predicted tellurium resistance membrane protein TerC
MTEILTVDNLLALLSLTSLEIVLGIDNIVFIAIIVGKLPAEKRRFVRLIGLALAMLMRILLLLTIKWIMHLTAPWFSLLGHPISGRDLVLFSGGLFLIGKATFEIHDKLELPEAHTVNIKPRSVLAAIVQITLLDIIFSLDSVVTAVGMAQALWVMIVAIVIAVLAMMAFSGAISEFIDRHPTFKMLALSFLLLVGVMLVAESFGVHIDRGYIYFAMGFSLLVEVLNMRIHQRRIAA